MTAMLKTLVCPLVAKMHPATIKLTKHANVHVNKAVIDIPKSVAHIVHIFGILQNINTQTNKTKTNLLF